MLGNFPISHAILSQVNDMTMKLINEQLLIFRKKSHDRYVDDILDCWINSDVFSCMCSSLISPWPFRVMRFWSHIHHFDAVLWLQDLAQKFALISFQILTEHVNTFV